MIGSTVSHYEIIEKLGEGGMGVVYKAHDIKLDRTVALKFLPQHLTATDEDKQRFIREAKAAAALNHPNICTIYSVEEHTGQQFISMEFVDGETLRQTSAVRDRTSAIRATDNRQLTTVIDYALQIAEALAEAHSKGIIHRDIKPENIMVDSKNRIKVMDFGLAKLKGSMNLTKAGSTVGTIAYMSPEQIQGEDVDHRSDIFSFGVVVYEMLTGHTPFRGEHEAAMVYSIVNEEYEPILKYVNDINPDLVRIIERTLEKNPVDRYQSIDHIISDLRHLKKKSSKIISTQHPRSAVSTGAKSATVQQVQSKYSTSVIITIPALKSRTGIIIVIAALVIIVGLLYFFFPPLKPVDHFVDRQSIAVLPLQNLSPDPEDAYFADGVHEDIIIQLSRIGDLRVIARSSVLPYITEDRNIRRIAEQLNVTTVLEGSVRRSRGRVRVAVQLIDTQTHQTLWGETFERDMVDLFAIQSNIAQEIAKALKASMTADIRKHIERRPTEVTEAYDLYLRARDYYNRPGYLERTYLNAEELLYRAVEKDPGFAHAYALLSRINSSLHWLGHDFSPHRIENAKRYAEKSFRLQPDIPETHIAMGYYYYHGLREYDGALKYFKAALEIEPNNADIISSIGYIQRRTGQFNESNANLRKAIELDPMDPELRYNLALTYLYLREYNESKSLLEELLILYPDYHLARLFNALVPILWNGDITPAMELFTHYPYLRNEIPVEWMMLVYFVRDFDSVRWTIEELPIEIYRGQIYLIPSTYILGLTYQSENRKEEAREYFKSALEHMKSMPVEMDFDPRYHSTLGKIYAYLGEKQRAIEEGKRAVELLPIEEDPFFGVHFQEELAIIYAQLGEVNEAVSILRYLLSIPSMVSIPKLQLDPSWDTIRNTPEFQQLLREHIR